MRILLFVPCFIDQLFPNVAVSALKVLKHLGIDVEFPEEQTCCGQPAYNSGYFDEARLVAMHEVNAFTKLAKKLAGQKGSEFESREVDIVGLSGSCIAMIRNFYPSLLEGDSRYTDVRKDFSSHAYEFSEFISKKIGAQKFSGRLDTTVSFHDSCHGLRELGLKKEPRELLERIEGLKLVELPYSEVCCGFGGTFSVKFPEISSAMADEKLKALEGTGCGTLVSGDSSCLMHLQGRAKKLGRSYRFAHIAEIMAESISRWSR